MSKVAAAHAAGYLLHFFSGSAGAVNSANKRANAATRDTMNWNLFFFQNLLDANVGNTARKSAAQCKPNLWARPASRR